MLDIQNQPVDVRINNLKITLLQVLDAYKLPYSVVSLVLSEFKLDIDTKLKKEIEKYNQEQQRLHESQSMEQSTEQTNKGGAQ